MTTERNDGQEREPFPMTVMVVALIGAFLAAVVPPPGIPRWITTLVLVVLTIGIVGTFLRWVLINGWRHR